MDYVMLKDVCSINMGQSPDSNSYNDEGIGVPFFQGNADFGKRYPVTRKWCSAPTKMAASEDILISVRAPIGAMNYAKEDCCIGRGLAALTPNKAKVSPEFIFWLLKGKNAELNSKGTGSTFKAIGRKVLEETLVPNLPLEKQLEYSEILERVYGVIQARKEELQKLDELIKARFVEMFGDENNSKNWDVVNVEEVADVQVGVVIKPSQYYTDKSEGVRTFRSLNIGAGFADYVLYDDMHRPLAVIEAKRTCVDVSKGRQQAKLYADLLEEKYKRRPVIFLTNGFETHIIDGKYPERKCAVIYSKRDLEKWFNLLAMRTSLKHVTVDKNIAGRYYQEAAVKSVCNSLDEKNRRKALLVMATGSGKTRTVIALCKCLLKAGWVKNILFLADRNSLVTQAKRSFVNMLPDLSCTNLVEEKDNYNAHCVFSTYQTMMNCIDTVNDGEGKSCNYLLLLRN